MESGEGEQAKETPEVQLWRDVLKTYPILSLQRHREYDPTPTIAETFAMRQQNLITQGLEKQVAFKQTAQELDSDIQEYEESRAYVNSAPEPERLSIKKIIENMHLDPDQVPNMGRWITECLTRKKAFGDLATTQDIKLLRALKAKKDRELAAGRPFPWNSTTSLETLIEESAQQLQDMYKKEDELPGFAKGMRTLELSSKAVQDFKFASQDARKKSLERAKTLRSFRWLELRPQLLPFETQLELQNAEVDALTMKPLPAKIRLPIEDMQSWRRQRLQRMARSKAMGLSLIHI